MFWLGGMESEGVLERCTAVDILGRRGDHREGMVWRRFSGGIYYWKDVVAVGRFESVS